MTVKPKKLEWGKPQSYEKPALPDPAKLAKTLSNNEIRFFGFMLLKKPPCALVESEVRKAVARLDPTRFAQLSGMKSR